MDRDGYIQINWTKFLNPAPLIEGCISLGLAGSLLLDQMERDWDNQINATKPLDVADLASGTNSGASIASVIYRAFPDWNQAPI